MYIIPSFVPLLIHKRAPDNFVSLKTGSRYSINDIELQAILLFPISSSKESFPFSQVV